LEWFGGNSQKNIDDDLFLAEKNCTTVSHEISHELLRQNGNKNYIGLVHDVWTKHLFASLSFKQFDKNFELNDKKPLFLTIDTSDFGKN